MPSEHDFTGRRALITGAASGIGLATAHWLAERGIGELILVDLDGPGLDAFSAACEVRRFAGDVSRPEVWDQVAPALAPLDHAVINAGIAGGCPLTEITYAYWKRMLEVNLDGAFLALQAALRAIGPRGGSVVLTGSAAGVKAVVNTAAYGTSKAAVAHLTRVAAAEHASRGVRVNAVAPGPVDTPIQSNNPRLAELERELGSRAAAIAKLAQGATLSGRFATAGEIAGQIGFLLSDQAANVTGTVLVTDGGYSL